VGVCATGTTSKPDIRVSGIGLPVRVLRRRLPAGEREGSHTHAFAELCHVESGRGVLLAGSRQAVAAAHTLTILPAGTPHALAADNGWACAANLVHFDPTAIGNPDTAAAWLAVARLAVGGHNAVSLRGTAGQAIEALIHRVATLCRQTDRPAEEACREALADLCRRLLRQVRDSRVGTPARPANPSGDVPALATSRPEIEQVLTYIEGNLTRPISRQDLARQAAFAPSYFSALFREATGTTIPEYINARRVRRAQDLLRDPQTRVSAVCYAVGFRDLSNFNRVFKRLVGQTPREFRRAVLGEGFDDEGDVPEARVGAAAAGLSAGPDLEHPQ